MKKVILSLVLFAAGITAFAADPSARVVVSLNSAYVVVRQSDASASYEAFGNPAIVAKVADKNYSEWTATDIEGLALSYIPKAENFNLSFSNVIGDLYLVDKVANTRTKIVEGATFPVTATAAEVSAAAYITNRFYISKVAGKEICYKYEALEISDYNGWNLTVTEKGQASPTINVPIESDYFKQSLADKTAGYYVVKLTKSGEDDIEYIISVKPAVSIVP